MTMDVTTTLLGVVCAVIGAGLGYLYLASRDFDRRHGAPKP